jgi:ADP-ribose pyrophosphatase
MIEKFLNEKNVFQGRIFSVHVDKVLLPNGKESTREIAEHKSAVCVTPLTSNGNLLFVKQFRYPIKQFLIELPAGMLEDYDVSPLECAKRELLEETGAVGENFISLGEIYTSPGFCTEIIYLYGCKIKSFLKPDPDEEEFLETVKIPFKKAMQMVIDNKIKDAKTQIAILKLFSKISF